MTKLNAIKILDSKDIGFFKKYSCERVFNTLTQIIYYGQVPMAAYILIEGKIILKDAQKRTIQECGPGSMLGLSEIFHSKAFRHTAEISAGSTVILLDRSTILEINRKHPIANFC